MKAIWRPFVLIFLVLVPGLLAVIMFLISLAKGRFGWAVFWLAVVFAARVGYLALYEPERLGYLVDSIRSFRGLSHEEPRRDAIEFVATILVRAFGVIMLLLIPISFSGFFVYFIGAGLFALLIAILALAGFAWLFYVSVRLGISFKKENNNIGIFVDILENFLSRNKTAESQVASRLDEPTQSEENVTSEEPLPPTS